jgi:segregation and condensation protein B
MSDEPSQPQKEKDSDATLSVDRLRAAFAEMLGHDPDAPTTEPAIQAFQPPIAQPASDPDELPGDVTPRSIIESLLFMGHPQKKTFSARELAAAMRGVSPKEVALAVEELNALYQQDGAPYEIISSAEGFHLVLRSEYGRMRDKFFGKVREAKLSQAAVEVLSIIAYHQPVTIEQLDELRRVPSHAPIGTLVRRNLVRLERPADQPQQAVYFTTDRFLRLFGLGRLEELPRAAECEAL